MNYLLDTNIYITFIRNEKFTKYINRKYRQKDNILFTSCVVEGELKSFSIQRNWGINKINKMKSAQANHHQFPQEWEPHPSMFLFEHWLYILGILSICLATSPVPVFISSASDFRTHFRRNGGYLNNWYADSITATRPTAKQLPQSNPDRETATGGGA
jgi:hypothetical protein